MKLWEMSWEGAKAAKWHNGRLEYGEEWGGDPPLEELYAELVDASNYLDEAVRRGDVGRGVAWVLRLGIGCAARLVRALIGREG